MQSSCFGFLSQRSFDASIRHDVGVQWLGENEQQWGICEVLRSGTYTCKDSQMGFQLTAIKQR